MEKQISKKSNMREEKQEFATIIRILQTDIPGHKQLLVGFTYIKGVSWTISNATCKILKLDPTRKIAELSEDEISKITEFLTNPGDKFPTFIVNRRKDFDTGEDSHIIGTSLDMKKEFDIRRLKKIRSYRGLRHAFGHPTRGQRTRSHFRAKGKKKAVGVKKKKK
ncbi:30S ribosomal protein S13 [Candidatus Pacearchaeota archaeon]|nr:30S ribosomal protein S13 [Candidatus Pacearchaeota archaeon]